MRFLTVAALVAAMLLPAVPAAAATTYDTPNGHQTIASMSDALRAAGYDGPWDADSVIQAYSATAGGDVTQTVSHAVVGVSTYQTANGAQTIASMRAALAASGYDGAQDDDSIVGAYAETTSADVIAILPAAPVARQTRPTQTPAATTPHSVTGIAVPVAAPSARPIVILVGGLDSRIDDPNWTLLSSLLQGPQIGFQSGALWKFSYANSADPTAAEAYGDSDTCKPIEQSEQKLAAMVRAIRQQQLASSVILVGHSLGGVLSVDTTLQNADLRPFVREVIAVDAPLGGISSLAPITFGADCGASNQLINRRAQAAQFESWYDSAVPTAESSGTRFSIVVNRLDTLVNEQWQCLCDLPVNFPVSASGPQLGHSGAFYDSVALSTIVGLIGPQS